MVAAALDIVDNNTLVAFNEFNAEVADAHAPTLRRRKFFDVKPKPLAIADFIVGVKYSVSVFFLNFFEQFLYFVHRLFLRTPVFL